MSAGILLPGGIVDENPLTTGAEILAALVGEIPGPYADDTAAASGGVPVGGLYHNAGIVQVRLI